MVFYLTPQVVIGEFLNHRFNCFVSLHRRCPNCSFNLMMLGKQNEGKSQDSSIWKISSWMFFFLMKEKNGNFQWMLFYPDFCLVTHGLEDSWNFCGNDKTRVLLYEPYSLDASWNFIPRAFNFLSASVVLPQIICPNRFSRWGFVTSTLSHRSPTGNHLQLYLPVVVFGWTLGSCCRNFHFSQGLWHGAPGWRGWESSRKVDEFFLFATFFRLFL